MKALELVQQRWSEAHDFDLTPDQWAQLLALYGPGAILVCIKISRGTRSQDPKIVYDHFETLLKRGAEQLMFQKTFNQEREQNYE